MKSQKWNPDPRVAVMHAMLFQKLDDHADQQLDVAKVNFIDCQ